MKLIYYKILPFAFQRFITVPCIVFPDELAPQRRIFGALFSFAPDQSPGHGFGIGIKEDSLLIKPKALTGIIGAVKAIPVFHGIHVYAINSHGIDISNAKIFRKRNLDPGLFLPMYKDNKSTSRGFLGVDAEINRAIGLHGGPKGKNLTNPVF